MEIIKNENAYPMGDWEKPAQLLITVKLDPVPGAWDNTEDFVQWLKSNSYVQSIEIKG